MPHAHSHDHDHDAISAAPEVARILRVVVAALVVATLVGLIVWRPTGGSTLPAAFDGQGERVDATVIGEDPEACEESEVGDGIGCVAIAFDVTSGPNAGSTGTFELYPEAQQATPDFDRGDRIVVTEYELGDTGQVAYTFADFQRARPLVILAVLFVVAVVALGRFQGVRALAGLVASGLVLFLFVFPSLLDGNPPLAVALVAASVIALAALYLAHGVNDTTTVALLGTMGALGLTGLLAWLFTTAAQITGAASEDQIYLLVSNEGIDLRGLVLAGIVLGSLGVLDDVTVTQVSAVARLREANPGYSVRDLYRTGVLIGRDHIASTVNTLVLAYAGAALPLLLFSTNVGIPLSQSATSEIVAVEIVRTLVGSIGLVSAVPITTLLAAVVVTGTGLREPFERRRGSGAPQEPEPEAEPPTSPPVARSWDDFEPEGHDF